MPSYYMYLTSDVFLTHSRHGFFSGLHGISLCRPLVIGTIRMFEILLMLCVCVCVCVRACVCMCVCVCACICVCA